jgi:hypothetical protein
VPTGKFAVCNGYATVAGTGLTINLNFNASVQFKINGVLTTMMAFGKTNRIGPLVFNAGDVLANDGIQMPTVNNVDFPIALNGFLYDPSTRKTPIAQRLIANSSSYTVPAGKHLVANFVGDAIMNIIIDDVTISTLNTYAVLSSFSTRYGPFTAAAGSVIRIAATLGGVTIPVLMTGFLYNNA